MSGQIKWSKSNQKGSNDDKIEIYQMGLYGGAAAAGGATVCVRGLG